ncbi:MAG: MerR family transcriptional regulator [Pseudomonadota bacterium]
MDKAPEAFRTISEVAEELDVPQHVLRFWETRFGQIKPMKRGGGRRFYRPNDVDLLKGIRALLYGEGYTIRGVQRILREEGLQHVSSIGRGETAARKRDARDLELDGVPAPGRALQAPRIKRPAPALGSAPFARGGEPQSQPPTAATAAPRMSESQVQSLRLALSELGAARKLLGADD